jgi:hypothetical protein
MARDSGRDAGDPSTWRRIPLARGLELHLEAGHPLARLGPGDAAIADALRQAVAKLIPQGSA